LCRDCNNAAAIATKPEDRKQLLIKPWTEEEIARFENCHPIGSRARLAHGLLLFTGQRRSDVIRMGRQHIRDGMLHVRQRKTGAELSIPVHPHLQKIIDASVIGQMTFLTTSFGKPFSALGFSNWFRKQCDMAGLHHCSAHGLRKAAARRLADAECTAHEIAAITGHASLREVARYTKGADQKRLATSAMQKMKTRTELSNLTEGLTKRQKYREKSIAGFKDAALAQIDMCELRIGIGKCELHRT
jgi:integrase